ncbi:tyrosine-type recombinase/integrase [Nocardioides sp. DS6]|uniref:Tyrosine-type recombinase/integrase n=1 Tax=Nocardioides eburneus TaxID=3231482 RepID=A0ABV3T0I7_9ACTN
MTTHTQRTNDMTTAGPADTTNSAVTPENGQLSDAVAGALHAVKALLDAGLITPQTLGLHGAAAVPESRPVGAYSPSTATDRAAHAMVPGDPIRIRDLVEKTKAGLSESTLRTYGTYLTFLCDGWPATSPEDEKLYSGLGDRWAHEVLASELEYALTFIEQRTLLGAEWRNLRRMAAGRVKRDTTATGAKYNAVGAWRRMYKIAVKDRHLAKGFDPSQEVDKPARLEGSRRPLRAVWMEDFWSFIAGTGNDPELDVMLCKTVMITGARREGLTNLELGWLDTEECTVRLDEKFGKVVDQPAPDWFVQELRDFAIARGARRADDKVFRYRPGRSADWIPITDRRLDYIFDRLQAAYEWADKRQVTAHVLRHHAIALVERAASKSVAIRFARHEPEDTTDRYGRASAKEVAQTVVRLYGGDHPWIHRDDELA